MEDGNERESSGSRDPDPPVTGEEELDGDVGMDGEDGDVDESILDSPLPPPLQPRLITAAASSVTVNKERSVTANYMGTRESSLARKTSDLGKILSKARLGTCDDDVFSTPPNDPPSKASGNSIGTVNKSDLSQGQEPRFPPAYNVIRAAKNKSMAAIRVGSSFGVGRNEAPLKTGYYGGLAAPGDNRSFRVQNFHSTEKYLNLSFSVSRPDNGKTDRLDCLACELDHSFMVKMKENGQPVLIVIADQNFPAALPMKDGLCPIVIRVEDGTMQDLTGVFLDRFKAYVSPHGALPPGSVIVMGSHMP